MKKLIALILIAALTLGALSGCVAGKKVMLFVEDAQSDYAKLLWAGFSKQAKKMGMKPILSTITEEQAIEYTVYDIWSEDIKTHDPAVLVVPYISDSTVYSLFTEANKPLVAIDPSGFSGASTTHSVYGATSTELARMAAERLIEMELPISGRFRLLYNKVDEAVNETFTACLEQAGIYNLEATPLSGRASEATLLNSFSEDTVATYNASGYDTETTGLSNLILCGATAKHLNALQNDEAAAVLCRNHYEIGIQAAKACAGAIRGKEVTSVTVAPLFITANGPEENGAAYWLELLA